MPAGRFGRFPDSFSGGKPLQQEPAGFQCQWSGNIPQQDKVQIRQGFQAGGQRIQREQVAEDDSFRAVLPFPEDFSQAAV